MDTKQRHSRKNAPSRQHPDLRNSAEWIAASAVRASTGIRLDPAITYQKRDCVHNTYTHDHLHDKALRGYRGGIRLDVIEYRLCPPRNPTHASKIIASGKVALVLAGRFNTTLCVRNYRGHRKAVFLPSDVPVGNPHLLDLCIWSGTGYHNDGHSGYTVLVDGTAGEGKMGLRQLMAPQQRQVLKQFSVGG
jgi:hypothetical protein